jgi:hypothetical protein
MSAHEIAEGQVPLDLRRADCEGVDLVRAVPVAIVPAKVAPARDPEFPQRFITQRLQPRRPLMSMIGFA